MMPPLQTLPNHHHIDPSPSTALDTLRWLAPAPTSLPPNQYISFVLFLLPSLTFDEHCGFRRVSSRWEGGQNRV